MSTKRVRQKSFKTKFKDVILFLHRWLGLITGIVVFIVSLTGCIFTFQKEINNWMYADTLYVEPPEHAQALPVSELKAVAQQALGDSIHTNFITTYRNPDKAWSFMVYQPGNPNAVTYFGAVKDYRTAFVNPYTGELTGIINNKYEFFSLIKYIHWSLLLNTPYGQPIVGWSTLVFVLLLISGLILWWPKRWTKTYMKKSFMVKWKSGWRRLNYDLHNVFGFYMLLIALILALTGMVWSFSWFQSAVYVAATQSTTPSAPMVSTSDTTATGDPVGALDAAFVHAWENLPEADRIGLSPPSPADNKGAIHVTGYRGKEVYYHKDALVYDQYTAELLDRKDYEDLNAGEKIIGMNYDIHVGAIAGLPGKIIAFLASLVCTSLPVTGFIIWWDREKRKRKRRQRDQRTRKRSKTRSKTPVKEKV